MCEELLKPHFDWAKQRDQGTGEFKTKFKIGVTFVMHTAPSNSTHTVYYSNGLLDIEYIDQQEVLKGTLRGWVSTPSKEKPQDIFPDTGNVITFVVTVNHTGSVTVQHLISNKPFLGRGPVIFQGTCSGKILVGATAGTAYTLSFTNSQTY